MRIARHLTTRDRRPQAGDVVIHIQTDLTHEVKSHTEEGMVIVSRSSRGSSATFVDYRRGSIAYLSRADGGPVVAEEG